MKSRIKGERFKVGDVVQAVVRRVHIDKQNGIQIELSRTSPKFLEELLALEVPEIKDGAVIIERSARIPGERARITSYNVCYTKLLRLFSWPYARCGTLFLWESKREKKKERQ